MNPKQSIRFFLIAVPTLLLLAIILSIREDLIEKNYEFKGIVGNVIYNINGSPDVYINGKKYALTYNIWNLNRKIEMGDSLITVRNGSLLKLVKKQTGETIYFKFRW
jgi:hypothetical protein